MQKKKQYGTHHTFCRSTIAAACNGYVGIAIFAAMMSNFQSMWQ
ncbi:MAG: hypothetical protein PHH42_15230 [Bacteroidales bacterium]|nr:hypothetical protein [Bacteroidales bacterium]MDD4742834.1 hypothetical protein [Bacteroidales bacterium]